MNCKIVKKTNPLGSVCYVAYIKCKWLFVFNDWKSVCYYHGRKQEIDLRDWDHEYNTIEEAKEAIQKYCQWKKGIEKIEIIGCNGEKL